MAESIPTGITADRSNRIMTVQWNDGHTSAYPFGLLRGACPCASCRGGHENMSSEPDPTVFTREFLDLPETRIAKIEAAGSYGMVIEWEDGHHYGIYNWHYFRALCPCTECRRR